MTIFLTFLMLVCDIYHILALIALIIIVLSVREQSRIKKEENMNINRSLAIGVQLLGVVAVVIGRGFHRPRCFYKQSANTSNEG